MQIISHKPLERVQIDITYFNNKIAIDELRDKYLLNFTDHFSKFCKGFLIDNKCTETIINKFAIYLKEIGKPEIAHTDNWSELSSKLYELFCKKHNIKRVYGGCHHPQSQGAVEAFNKTIIQKLQYEKLEKKDKFNIGSAIEVVYQIYNNTVHSIIRVEPLKAFKFKKTKQINKVIENTIKSQISVNNSSIAIKNESTALLSTNFIRKRKVLKETFKKKFVIQFQL